MVWCRFIPAVVLAGFVSLSLPAPSSFAAPTPASEPAFSWPPAAADDLIAALAKGRSHAIDTRELISRVEGAQGPARDRTLTEVALSYANSLAHGLVEPRDLHDIFGLETNAVDVEAGLARALAAGRLGPWLDSLPPQDAEYAALSRAYLRYAERPEAEDIAEGPLIRPGDRDARMPEIAAALRRLGYLPAGPAPQSAGRAIVAAVRAFQTDYGLNADGIIGRSTLTMINKGPADRARQLAVNLERRRWLAREPPIDRIDVNLAAGLLTYVRNGQVAWTTRIIAGAPQSPTPLLEESFSQVVVNPPWNVPQSIAEREILPKGEAYLQAHDMVVTGGRVIQRPGPQAALGQVKFDMQNRYAIYLHDTPAKALFDKQERFFSHGCVRVEDAVEFARRLAEESGKNAEFEDALASGATRVVRLQREIPVRLLYRTVFLGEDGQVQFRPDPYGWDERVARAIGLTPGLRAAVPAFETDVGP